MGDPEADLVRIPRLRSARLLLRAFQPADFEAFAVHFADAESARYTGGVLARPDAWRVFNSCMGGWVVHGAGWWALELVATKQVAGLVGAFYRDGHPDLELGWGVFKEFGRQGLGTEAVERVLQYVGEHRSEQRVIALIDHGNEASMRVATKVGFAYDADMVLKGEPVQRFVRVRPR